MSTNTVSPLRFVGQTSRYMDIGVRGTELLGLSIQYAVHPSNVGCLILRFVAHGEGVAPGNFTHLTYRESAKFLIPGTESTPNEMFRGLRLNKIALPVFKPAVHPYEVADKAAVLGVWFPIVEWITEQVQAEGFTLVTDLLPFLQESVVVPAKPVTEGTITSVLQFPDLKGEAMKQATLAQVQDPVEDEDEYDADEDGDEDEDEDSEDEDDAPAPKSKASKYN